MIFLLLLFSLKLEVGNTASPLPGSLQLALTYLKLKPEEIHFRTDYEETDVFRLKIINDLLLQPLNTTGYLEYSKNAVFQSYSLNSLLSFLTYQLSPSIPSPPSSSQLLNSSILPPSLSNNTLAKFSEDVINILLNLQINLKEACASLSAGERDSLQQWLLTILLESDEKTEDLFIQDKIQQESDLRAQDLLKLVEKIDRSKIQNTGLALSSILDSLLSDIKRFDLSTKIKSYSVAEVEGPVYYFEESKGLSVIIGGLKKNIYHRNFDFILDLGGDDIYLNQPGSNHGLSHSIGITIDLSGSDTYLSQKPFSLGCGFFGIGVLYDFTGNDTYRAGHFSLGCGLLGIGILLDGGGDDQYDSDILSQGAGAWGIGILKDLSGNDQYQSHLHSQGFGYVAGLGLLEDRQGHDHYQIQPKYVDEIRYDDHFESLSQGFGLGLRPYASGGIGLLIDSAGNDTYIADIYGQGAAYWFALGGLLDLEGNDQYLCYQYAQGAGIHIALGALLDQSGNDRYLSKGVSQGCGHDLSFGILLDKQGNDFYEAEDLSQGAGNANGIGILMDQQGGDFYRVKNPVNTQGYGENRRLGPSIGIFIDSGKGEDQYLGRGKNNFIWKESYIGIGMDH